MKIAIDLDDVLSDSVTAVLAFHNANYEPKILAESLGDYSYWGFLGKTREEANEKYFAFTKSNFFKETKPLLGAQEAINRLSLNHELYVITGRPYFTKNETKKWLEKHFPKKFKKIYYTNRRRKMNNFNPYWGKPKSEICHKIGADVLIDDLPEYLNKSENINRVYLLKKPWDQGKIPSHAKVVADWNEIVADLTSL